MVTATTSSAVLSPEFLSDSPGVIAELREHAPDRFDIERDTRDVIMFGRGPHFCLGANLAKQELRCMIEGALEFLPPNARLREDLVRWSDMVIMRRMENLPVDFGG